MIKKQSEIIKERRKNSVMLLTCPIEVIELSSWLKEVKKWTK